MSGADDRLARLRGLVDAEAPEPSHGNGVDGRLGQICRAVARSLPASGAGVTIMDPREQPATTVAASGPRFRRLEELQFILGEGPCVEAYAARRPVLEPSLAATGMRRWPGYSAEARELGVGAVFAFPLQVGAARIGVLDVYRDEASGLTSGALADALGFASLSLKTLLDAGVRPDGNLAGAVGDVLRNSAEVYQAQGALMVQLGVSLTDAMARLRAYAYAHDRPVKDVARDILAGTLEITREDP